MFRFFFKLPLAVTESSSSQSSACGGHLGQNRWTHLIYNNILLLGIFAQTTGRNGAKVSLLFITADTRLEDNVGCGSCSNSGLQAPPSKWIYLLLCLTFFSRLAHGFTAVLTLACAEERDAAEAELVCALNIFWEVELGLHAAATLPPQCGFPGELEQRGAF